METIGSYEAKTNLAKLLVRVSKGERIVITKHGNPIAKLVPYESKRKNPKKAVESIKRSCKGNILGDDVSIKELINEGRD